MVFFCLDGSALAKRYAPEAGSALMDFILYHVAEHRLFILNTGVAEVVSVLVRQRMAGKLSDAQFRQGILELDQRKSPGPRASRSSALITHS